MKNLNLNLINLNLIKLLSIFFLILAFTLPVIVFGTMDQEDYNFGFFSSKLISKSYLDPYMFFSDSIGPGINFPMGNGILFNPLLLFANNSKLFYFFIIFFHLSIQSYFFLKINKLLNVKKYVIFFIPIIILSNSNFNYHYSDDWITASSCFSLLFVVLYFGLLLIYTFNAIVISGLIYFIMIPVSLIHYTKLSKNFKEQPIANEEHEDIL